MYENMTRKGLALGAGVALVATSFGVLPASAVTHTAGTDDGSVSLVPTAGTAYSVLTDGTFDLSANYDASLTASSRFLKFLVKDTGSQVKVDVDENQSSNDTAYDQTVAISTATTLTSDATVTVNTAVAHNLVSGDLVSFAGSTAFVAANGSATNFKTGGSYEVTVVDSDTFTFESAATDETSVTVTSAVVAFSSSEVTSASGEERTGDDYLTVVVDNSSQFLPGDTVAFVEADDTTGTATDITDGTNNFGALTGLTVIAVDDATNSVTVSKSSLAVDEDGTYVIANNARLMLTDASTGDDTALSARDDIAGKALGNFRILGGNTELKVSARDTDGSFVVTANDNTVANDMVLRLVNTDTTESYSVDVIAWVDNNGNGAIDLTEKVSPTRTVNFYENDDLTVTTTLDSLVLGAASFSGTVAISPELNGQQVGAADADVTVTATLQAGTATVTQSYNTVTKVWDYSVADNNNIEIGTFTVRAKVAGAAIGDTVTRQVAAAVATDTKMVAASSVDQTYAKDETAAAGATSSTVRKGKAANATVTVYDTNGKAVGAGIYVTLNLSNATTTTDWFVNGVKVLDNANSGSKVYQTDANGQLVLEIKSTSMANGDTIDVQANPENIAVDNAAAAEITFAWQTATYAINDVNAPLDGSARGITRGGSVTYDLVAGDQWNAPLTGNYRLYVTTSGRTTTGQNVDFSTGKASLVVADQGLGTGTTISVSATLQKLGSDGVTWSTSTDATAWGGSTITTSAAPVTSVILSSVTETDGSGDSDSVGPDLTQDAIDEYNVYTTVGSFTDPADSIDAAYFTISSGVSAGEMVTVSGEGLYFGYADASDSDTIKMIGKDSLSFILDNTSDKIFVYSNVYAKEKVVTVSSRGRSGTVKITTDVAKANAGAEWVIDIPAAATPGSTFKVTATLKDAFGNPVKIATANDVAVKYSGPGIVFGTLPNTTDADGQLSFAVLLGSNDSGTATVTVYYDQNSDNDFTGTVAPDVDVVASKSLVVGTAGNTGAYSSWTKKLDDNSAKMYAKNVVGEGKVQFFLNGEEIAWVRAVDATDPKLRTANGSAYLVRTVEFEDGKNVLEIYVDGVRTTRTAYTK